MDNKTSEAPELGESLPKKHYQKPILREFGSLHMTTQGSNGRGIDGAGRMTGTMGMGMGMVMGNGGMGMGMGLIMFG